MWIHQRPESTVGVYTPEIRIFRKWIGSKPIAQITLEDLQRYAVEISGRLKPATCHRKLSTIKSLLTFTHRIGVTQFNVGAALRMPHVPNDLAEKILTEKQIAKLLESDPNVRNRVMLRLMYVTGIRAAEVAGLRWLDLRERKDAGQITVLGKGAKTRTIMLTAPMWRALLSIRPSRPTPEDSVFTRQDGLPMNRTYVTNIVVRAGRRAGLPDHISAHWLRHAHATHSLDHGAPIPLIQQTLGHASIDTTSRYIHVNPDDSSCRFLRA